MICLSVASLEQVTIISGLSYYNLEMLNETPATFMLYCIEMLP